MARNRRDGVVKQLSNLTIDEVSLVDRGANQHALISIAKRAPEASDAFEIDEVEKNASDVIWPTAPFKAREGRKLAVTGRTMGRSALEGAVGAKIGGGVGLGVGALTRHPFEGAAAGEVAGAVGGAFHGAHAALKNAEHRGDLNRAPVVHNHFYGETAKRLEDEPMDVDDLFSVSKKGGSSFGRGGQAAGIDTFTGNDPSGVTDDPDGEEGEVGPGGKKIGGVETTQGEDMPPQKKKTKGASKENNPAPLSGLGKSADYWTEVIEKALGGDEVGKHFPGAGGGNPMNPQQSPFPGAAGAGQPPTMQTPGVQPMGMGQPTPPPGQPMPGAQGATGGMPQQLPPDVVAYIQQLEQALDQATGGQQDGQEGDDSSSDPSQSNSSDDKKNNPFGKSGDFDMSDDLFLAELAKSLDDEDQREAVGKALQAVSKAEQRAQQAETIAKQERDLRLEREFIAKAAEFNVPVSADELGPVLKRMAESVTKDDFQVIVKCLNAVSAKDDIFGEVGKRGGGANGSVLDEVNARAMALATGGDVSKALSPEAAVAEVFEMDPRAYDAYLSDHPSRRISR